MVYKFFDKKSMGSGNNKEKLSSLTLADELHKPIIKTFGKKKYIHNLKIIYGD